MTGDAAAPLFTSFTVGSLTVPNRFVMAPMTRGQSPEGVPGPRVVDYYRRRTEGGVGLIVTEGVGIDHPSALGYNDYNGTDIPFLFTEPAMAGWRDVVRAVHDAGGKIAPQLWHQGVMRLDGTPPFAATPSIRPSGLWGPKTGRSTIAPEQVDKLAEPTRPATEEEIADIVAGFARSAKLAQDAGFDAIALHGAHGYLIDSFLWEETNRRADRYGGDRAGRTRFAVEVVRAIRAVIRPDLPIILRFSQWKQQDFEAKLAQTPDELAAILCPIAEAGVDVMDASTRRFDEPAFEGSELNLAGWAKKLTGKASMTVGGIGLDKDMYASLAAGGSQPSSLEAVLRRFERREFDLAGVGRALIADPDWVERIRHGRERTAFTPMMLAELH